MRRFKLGDSRRFVFLESIFFVAGGGFGTLWVGAVA